MEVLERIASRIALVEDENFFVDVEGHTDNRPVTSGRYGSNWDLSTARSSNVVEVLLENGFTPIFGHRDMPMLNLWCRMWIL